MIQRRAGGADREQTRGATGDRSPPLLSIWVRSGMGFPIPGRTPRPALARCGAGSVRQRLLDPQLPQLLQPDLPGDGLSGRNPVDLGLDGLRLVSALPEKRDARGHQSGRTKQVDSGLSNRSLLLSGM